MLTLLLSVLLHLIRLFKRRRPLGERTFRRYSPLRRPSFHPRRKPAWVRREIIRLAALHDRPTCRLLADIFNRRFAARKGMTVGRTFVNALLRTHRYEVLAERRRIKNARPHRVPDNLVWAMDLTGKTDARGRLHSIFGLIDHGSRTMLALAALADKSSFTLLGHLCLAVGRHGRPKAVRTDNEAVFTSRVFRSTLFLLGIRHQRIDLHCPWQNGRIERFYGTLKDKLDRLAVDSLEGLNHALVEFCFFYNHVRPHQNLEGATPAEARAGINPYAARIKGEYWFEAWDGLLCGYYLRR